MTLKRALVVMAAVGSLAGAVLVMGPACGPTPCTPDEHDLGDAPLLTMRKLPGLTIPDQPCATPRTILISSEAELRAYYEALGVVALPDGAPPTSTAIEYPSVDFARERVVVNESSAGEGISWAVKKGDAVVVGLLGCGGSAIMPNTCTVQLAAVPALVTAAEARKCEPVGCGQPLEPPPRSR